MPRPHRRDYPGAIHHVMNQGNGRRPIFESRRDVRYFLSLVARCAKRGQIEVLAYVLMTTHFHLLVRCPNAELSQSLQWIQSMYGRYFNRTRGKHGTSYRGRFRSKLVESRLYLRILVWYIDRNPVEAGLAALPAMYPYGSAWHYSRHNRGPRWLDRSVIEHMVCAIGGLRRFDPGSYVRTLCAHESDALRDLVETALASDEPAPLRHLDDLVGAAPEHVQRWLAQNAAQADGAPSRCLVVSGASIRAAVATARARAPDRSIKLTRRQNVVWPLLEAGLLHWAAGCTMQHITEIQSASVATVHGRVRTHRRGMADCTEYRDLAGSMLREALEADFGPLAARIPKKWV